MHALSIGQSPRDFRCYSAITAIGALGPGAWVLGHKLLHNVISVYDYGARSSSRSKGAPSPRVGIGQLTAAEKAAAEAQFDKALGSKRSSAVQTRRGVQLLGLQVLSLMLLSLVAQPR